jgi:hypothetical protein
VRQSRQKPGSDLQEAKSSKCCVKRGMAEPTKIAGRRGEGEGNREINQWWQGITFLFDEKSCGVAMKREVAQQFDEEDGGSGTAIKAVAVQQ